MVDQVLSDPPESGRARELWAQHAAGFLIFQDVRDYARQQVSPALDDCQREIAHQAIDDAVYGLMMVLDGVPDAFQNDRHRLELRSYISLSARTEDGFKECFRIDDDRFEGFCMGYHGWREGDFGKNPVAVQPT